jgi:hypothetical protein
MIAARTERDTTTMTHPKPRTISRTRGRIAVAACLGLLALSCLVAAPALATYGDQYELAPAEGAALPGPKAFWAGTCDLGAAPPVETPIPGGVGVRPAQVVTGTAGFPPVPAFGPAPALPEDCIDPGVGSLAGTARSPWITPPSWRLPAVSQAGAHPDASTVFAFTRDFENQSGAATLGAMPAGSTRDITVALPPGLAGNPDAVPQCPNAVFEKSTAACPPQSQVGVADLRLNGSINVLDIVRPVYNLEPRGGQTAEFGMPNVTFTSIRITAKARTDGDFGLNTGVERIPTGVPLLQQSLTFWGVPWAASHDAFRLPVGTKESIIPQTGFAPAEQVRYQPSWGPIEPFLSNPTHCEDQGPVTTIYADSWQNPAATKADGDPDPADPNWKTADSESPAVTGCDKLANHFSPGFTFQPQSHSADTPSAYDADLSLPQNNQAPIAVPAANASRSVVDRYMTEAEAFWKSDAGLATSHLKDTTVTLPRGLTVNASGANGLEACSEAQIGLTSESPVRFDNDQPTCPAAAKIGTVEIDTPLLAKPLLGTVYLATQSANPFHSLLALYLVAQEPERNLIVKLAGKATTDPASGQITASFADNPQLPFDHVKLHFKGGSAAPLKTPVTCGTYTTAGLLSPWSGQAAVATANSFQVTGGPNGSPCPSGRFNPSMNAGTSSSTAGSYSPFVLDLSRDDGTQELKGIDLTLPKGLLGKLAGVPYCSEAALGTVARLNQPGQGAAQIAAPSCPAASQVGKVTVGVGAGPAPLYVDTGRAYLAGPYKGAPLSLAIATPAVAGPFDLGNVLVRVALYVDPSTAQLTAKSDPLPTILDGIPLDIRDVRVSVDRPGFTLNPTNCNPSAIDANVFGVVGASVARSSRFQVGGCAALSFKPKLKIRLKGATKRIGHPALTATVTMPQGGANIAGAQVNLPHGEFLDQGNLNKTCTRPVLLAGNCPKSSVYGKARAWTPLLDKPLEGPVYLVGGYGYKLPALVAELNGQIKVLLVGKVDSGKNRGIRNTFEVVPDAPVEKFELAMKGGKKYGLLENSENLCKTKKAKRRAIVRFTGQNGKVSAFKPLVQNECGKGKKKHKKHSGHGRTR